MTGEPCSMGACGKAATREVFAVVSMVRDEKTAAWSVKPIGVHLAVCDDHHRIMLKAK